MKNKPIRKSFYLDPEVYDSVKQAATEDRRTTSSMAEILLRDALKTHKVKRNYGGIPTLISE